MVIQTSIARLTSDMKRLRLRLSNPSSFQKIDECASGYFESASPNGVIHEHYLRSWSE